MSQKNDPGKEQQDAIRYFVWVASVVAGVIVFFIGYVHANFLDIDVANERSKNREAQISTLASEVKGLKNENQTFRIWAVQNWGKKNPAPYPVSNE